MEEFIKIDWDYEKGSLSDTKEDQEKAINTIKEKILSFVEATKKGDKWDPSIKKIIVTDKYEEEIAKQAKMWNISYLLSSEKEYIAYSKVLFNRDYNNPINHIYFNGNVLFSSVIFENDLFQQSFIGQFIKVFSHSIIPDNIKQYEFNNPLNTFDDYINKILNTWIPLNYSNKIEKQLFPNWTNKFNADSLFNAFLRHLKRNLYEYNSDEKDNAFRLLRFWNETFRNFSNLISRLIDIKQFDGDIKLGNKNHQEIIDPIISNICSITDKLASNEDFDISEIKETILTFFSYFKLIITEREANFHIKLSENPKIFFVDTLIDTEPRFVCFIDILGFSEMIEEYDNELTSSILQDIQESFSQAISSFKNDFLKNNELVKYLKYQLFSDNVSISIPYFDNEEDFLANFNLISIFIRGFQLSMMSKGFFVRGGLSIGSYYSDDNIIFSKGLVNAYHLESKKAIYPRVLIDNVIIEKLKNYSAESISNLGINKYLVEDWEGSIFLNPFNLTTDIVSQFEAANELIKMDDDDVLGKTLNDLVDISFSIAKETYTKVQDSTPDILNDIKFHVSNNKRKYSKKESVLTKYIWIEEFMKWLEDENSSNLKFKYLFEYKNGN